MQWGSNSTSQARAALPSTPTRKTRSRRWAKPKNCASRILHARPYPTSSIARSRHRKASPFSLESAPGTFSQTKHLGMASRTARINSSMRPDSPLSPVLFPATEKLWHGLPPMTTSISPRISFHSTFDISPRLGTLGKRVARTALQNGSISLKATASQPSGPHAQLAASMPEKRLTYLTKPPSRRALRRWLLTTPCRGRRPPRTRRPCSERARGPERRRRART